MADGPGIPPAQGGRPPAPGVSALLQIGAMCGLNIGVGVLVGYLLDGVLSTTPLLVFVGLAIGIVGAATGSYFIIRPYLANAPSGSSDRSTRG